MIVLVNDEQREAFKGGEVGGDGFQRQVEDGKEVLTEPNNLLDNVSLPEPGMFLGVGAMGFFLIYFVRE
ncbi:hypothetical protein AFK68_32185 [Hydrocoleum sp. CS-953]|uniref:hypothetical protein n=1 Tax=Hydrocoleum sp. CS-953 TaxID=1671698 RepID=UPI000B9B79EB|nr:hypothetical protein [Hydrocoleum sp. CS-953]OZH51276.1 hypothetical protein AFK68_32185 [Hydrocoleum sp. CS-953]